MCGQAYVFPAKGGVAVLAIDVCHRMEPCEQQPLLGRATAHVHPEKDNIGIGSCFI